MPCFKGGCSRANLPCAGAVESTFLEHVLFLEHVFCTKEVEIKQLEEKFLFCARND